MLPQSAHVCQARFGHLWPGGHGRLPTRGSHRSGRARFGHPAPQAMESLRGGEFTPSRTRWPRKAKFASFACRVEMTSRLDVLAICPSQSPTARSAASLRRVPWGGFPDFPGTISGLRPLPARPASLRCLRSAVPPVAPFASPEPGRCSGAWATSTAAPGPPAYGGDGEVSQVPGRPLPACPALRPRRTARIRPLRCARCCLPHI